MIERRKIAVERAILRAASLGIRIDDDPIFADLISNWADGSITLAEARAAYVKHVGERERAKADWRALSIQARNEELRLKLNRGVNKPY